MTVESKCAGGPAEHGAAHPVLVNEELAPQVHRLVVRAPRIAATARPGQFVIVHLGDGAERIPLTIAERDPDAGTIVLVVQAVGKSTTDLCALEPGADIHDVAGPLGRPSDLVTEGTAVCVAGGVGAAVVFPIARRLAEFGVRVVTVLGSRTAESLVYADRFDAIGSLVRCTDDGSVGRHGFVTEALAELLEAGDTVDVVYAAGPVAMMRAVADVTRPGRVRTIASLNPIMVDGTGMCGGCRVTVGEKTKFACVDGPEFNAHEVDFDDLMSRLQRFRTDETQALDNWKKAAS